MRHFKWLVPLLLLTIIFSLSACGQSLQKPTGLEAEENTEVVGDTNSTESLEDNQSHELKQKEDKTDGSQENKKENSSSSTESEDTESEDKSESATNQAKSEKPKEKSGNENSNQDKSKANQQEKEVNGSDQSKEKTSKSSKKDQIRNGSDQSSNDEPDETNDGGSNEEETEQESTITHSIVISSDEVPLSPTKQVITDEDTVLDALISITKEKGIHMDYRGGQGATAYVQGMGNVYEFDRGQGSGWMYSVNEIFPDRGAGVVPLCDGDVMEWLYTTDLGADLDADLEPFRRDGKCP